MYNLSQKVSSKIDYWNYLRKYSHMRHVLNVEGYFYCISLQTVVNIANTVLQWFVLDLDNKSFGNLISVLNLIKDPIRDCHSAG